VSGVSSATATAAAISAGSASMVSREDMSLLYAAARTTLLANRDPRFPEGLSAFTVVGFLGRGGYGHVELVRHKPTGTVYALKTLFRTHVMATRATANVVRERRLAARVDSPHVVRLHATFKDEKRLYFLLEPALGGELFQLLRSQSSFNEKTARFYAALVLRGLEAIHAQGIVYRDLKPENVLLDALGYVKLADFGLAKDILVTGRTFTVCGTPHYLAPEVIAGTGHGFAVDLWCLGVLIYEMIVGHPPFYHPDERGSKDQMALFKRIYAGEFARASCLSDDAWDLICALLQKKPALRLGANDGLSPAGAGAVPGPLQAVSQSQPQLGSAAAARSGAAPPQQQQQGGQFRRGAFKLLRAHPWFRSVDWAGLTARTVRAPISPFVRGEEDTANFRDAVAACYRPDLDVVPKEDQSWDAEF